jgi:hypothetical protein
VVAATLWRRSKRDRPKLTFNDHADDGGRRHAAGVRIPAGRELWGPRAAPRQRSAEPRQDVCLGRGTVETRTQRSAGAGGDDGHRRAAGEAYPQTNAGIGVALVPLRSCCLATSVRRCSSCSGAVGWCSCWRARTLPTSARARLRATAGAGDSQRARRHPGPDRAPADDGQRAAGSDRRRRAVC